MRTNNHYYRLLKRGKKRRIKKKTYLKYCCLDNYDSDGDYNMENIELKPKSILKKTQKGTNTEIWSDKQVRFNDSNKLLWCNKNLLTAFSTFETTSCAFFPNVLILPSKFQTSSFNLL